MMAQKRRLRSNVMPDQIIIDGMQIMARVGVPDEERARPQKLEVSVVMELDLSRAAQTDQLAMSVDYAEAQRRTIEVVQQKPRFLIETMAEDIAQRLLRDFQIARVEVEVKKFVLENTRSVAVRISRRRVQTRN